MDDVPYVIGCILDSDEPSLKELEWFVLKA